MSSILPPRISSPPWWQLIQWIIDPIEFQIKASHKYGDTFTMCLAGLGEFVIIGNPQAIQQIFSQDSKFDVGRANALAQPLIGQNSLMLMDGDRHRRERKLLMPPFHGEKLKAYADQICQITKQITSQWQVGEQFEARSVMQQISLEVILQVVFGISEGDRYQQLKPLLTDWLNMTDSPVRSSMLFLKVLQQNWGRWSPWGRMKQRQHNIYHLLQAEIDERRHNKQKEYQDVLSLMMATQDEDGKPMSDAELKDELLTILFAGHETTATILAWALYQIQRQHDIREKLNLELDTLGEYSSPLETAQLPYLTAVCQETLRMYPVLPVIFPRVTKSPIEIAGYKFATETTLMPSIYLVHNREDLYPHAQEFKPERFLACPYSPSEYLPFGGGSRRCLGYALAQLEMKLVLATILSKYEFALADHRTIQLQRRGFTLAPAGGVPMTVIGIESEVGTSTV